MIPRSASSHLSADLPPLETTRSAMTSPSPATGADYAKGSRFIQGGGTSDMPALRKWGNWALTGLARLLFRGTKFTDLCYGYNAYWARVAPILLDARGFEIETVMNLRAVRAGL